WDMHYNTSELLRAQGLNAHYLALGFSSRYQERLALGSPIERTLPLRSLASSVTSATTCYADRPIDILFVGTISPRRAAFFANNASFFARYECFIYLPEGNTPFLESDERTLDFRQMAGLAARSKIMINIHRDSARYLEWQRIATLGINCGTLIVSEGCDPCPVLHPGLSYVDVPLHLIPETCAAHLQDVRKASAFVTRSTADFQQRLCLHHDIAELIGCTVNI
ncbi:MAG TPA: hypothetical protein PLZ86_05085, partial [bacterium]|nr:hypothetical protein [bacterium]